MKRPKRPAGNERGVAMMMAMITMMLMTILAAELVYETSVYNGIVFREVDQLRARMLARSGLRLALLQVRAAKKAAGMAKSMGLGDAASGMVDMLWQTPLVLPPPAAAGNGAIETEALNTFSEELGIPGTISVVITGENNRVSLNTLVWGAKPDAKPTNPGATNPPAPAPAAAATTNPEQVKQQNQERLKKAREGLAQVVDQLLMKQRETQEGFDQRHGGVNGQILVGNLLAWMDPATEQDGEGREKHEYYNRASPEAYAMKEAPLASETELYMVKGFDDEIARLFQDNFTTQYTNGINVNDASALLLQALIPELSPTDAEAVIKRREDASQGGRFKNEQEFWTFLGSLNDFSRAQARLKEQGFKIFGAESAYRVAVTATSGQATKNWVASIGPYPAKAANAPVASQPGQTGQQIPNPTASAGTNAQKKDDAQDLHVLYLKAD